MEILGIGLIILGLFAVIALGNLWFYFVESVWQRIKRLFSRGNPPSAWHPLPEEEEKRTGK